MSFSQRLKNRNKSMDMFATAGTIGLHMVSGPAVGFALGYGVEFLCAHMGFNITPWGKLVGFIIGIGGGFLNVYEDSRRLLRKKEKAMPEAEQGMNQVSGNAGGVPAAGQDTKVMHAEPPIVLEKHGSEPLSTASDKSLTP